MATGLTHTPSWAPWRGLSSLREATLCSCLHAHHHSASHGDCDCSVLAPRPLDCAAKAGIMSSGAPTAGPDLL